MRIISLIVLVCLIAISLYLFFGGERTKDKVIQNTTPLVQAGYESYTSETDFSTDAEDTIVLFFHADRCSSCNVIDKDIQQQGVPDNMKIYKVNYDTEADLLARYDVRTQSSFAQIDKEGNLIKRWVGGFGVDDIVTKVQDNEIKPWERVREEEAENADSGKTPTPKGDPFPLTGDNMIDTSIVDEKEGTQVKTAYFAGGCFWCLEGPFEAMDGVESAISGYLGGTAETANYRAVGSGKTKHREGIKVVYDPTVTDFALLVQTYRYQIDPTDAGGQFADRGYQYTTAIYYQDEFEKTIAQESKDTLNLSKKFDDPIAVLIEPFTTFFAAEEEHQDYYLKQSAHYNRYKKGSGRAGYIEDTWKDSDSKINTDSGESLRPSDTSQTPTPEGTPSPGQGTTSDGLIRGFGGGVGEEGLDDLQRKVIYEQGTEPPFNNAYRDHKEAGIYVDILDGTPLFSSTDKFDSGTGRPSFTTPIDQLLVALEEDTTYGMVRTEVETADGKHLGHVFNDGPGGKERYCINSAALDFVPLKKMEEMGYGEYLVLFE